MAKDTEVRIDLEYDMNHGREFWYASIRNNCERLLTAYPARTRGLHYAYWLRGGPY